MSGPLRAPPPRPMPDKPETIRTRARRQADAEREAAAGDPGGSVTIFIETLEVMARIGVHPHEHGRTQRIFVDVQLDLGPAPAPADDRLGETVDYEALAGAVESMCRADHVQLVETLAERIIAWCFKDARVRAATVRIAKPEALSHAAAAGCVVRRVRADEPPVADRPR